MCNWPLVTNPVKMACLFLHAKWMNDTLPPDPDSGHEPQLESCYQHSLQYIKSWRMSTVILLLAVHVVHIFILLGFIDLYKLVIFLCGRQCLPRLLQQSAKLHFSTFQHHLLLANGEVCCRVSILCLGPWLLNDWSRILCSFFLFSKNT